MIGLAGKVALNLCGVVEPRLSIVLFHRVLTAPDPLLPDEPDIARFATLLRWLRDSFTILPLRDALSALFAGRLPRGALCITFDDGYRDNAQNALPVLRDLGVPATFFITTALIDGGMMWNDRVVEAVRAWPRPEIDLSPYGLASHSLATGGAAAVNGVLGALKYLPHDARAEVTADLLARAGVREARAMMDEREIRLLHAQGMEVGGHTISHPILSVSEDSAAAEEIAGNKRALEGIIGTSIESFAYPNGRPRQDYLPQHMRMARECGYRWAVTTAAGTAHAASDPLQIPRFTPWDRTRPRYIARMLQNYFRNAVTLDE